MALLSGQGISRRSETIVKRKRKSALEWYVCIAIISLGTKSTNKPLRLHKKCNVLAQKNAASAGERHQLGLSIIMRSPIIKPALERQGWQRSGMSQLCTPHPIPGSPIPVHSPPAAWTATFLGGKHRFSCSITLCLLSELCYLPASIGKSVFGLKRISIPHAS